LQRQSLHPTTHIRVAVAIQTLTPDEIGIIAAASPLSPRHKSGSTAPEIRS